MKDKLVDGKTLIFGNGAISKRLQELIDNYDIIDSKTKIDQISEEYQNVVVGVPLNKSTEKYVQLPLVFSQNVVY